LIELHAWRSYGAFLRGKLIVIGSGQSKATPEIKRTPSIKGVFS